MSEHLKFSKENAKLQGQGILTFNLPAGFSCPGARECKAFADPDTGTITDGPCQRHRCYMATLECAYPNLRRLVWHNFNLLTLARETDKQSELLEMSFPRAGWRGVRIHTDGDFFSLAYFRAWMGMAERHPGLFFYAYTKSLNFWVSEEQMGRIPTNMTLTASRGGKYDKMIDQHGLREAIVVHHPDDAERMHLEIDHDDKLAQNPRVKRFALLLHGMGPKGSKHAAALKKMREQNIQFSYPRA
jgi:hypothetical protein